MKWPFPTTAKATEDPLPSFPPDVRRAGGQTAPALGQWGIFGQWDTYRDLHTQKALQLSKGKGPPCSRVPPTRSLARRHCLGQYHCHFFAGSWTRWAGDTSPAGTAQGGWALTKSAKLQAAAQLSCLRGQDMCCCIQMLLHPLWRSAWKARGGKI